MDIKSICVYCASSSQVDRKYFNAAYQLGKGMAQRGIMLVNGAGNQGLMNASANGCLQNGGQALGIIPTFMIEEGWCHQHMTRIVETADMHMRQQKMAQMSDAAIFLPGGCGTLAEMSELITWKQLGLYLKPIVILNTDGYYDSLLAFLQQSADAHFMRQQHTAIWRVATTPEEALHLVQDTPMWDTSIRRFAAL